jgi:hypothetical protein
MRTDTSYSKTITKMIWFMALLLVVVAAGCDRDHGSEAPAGPLAGTVPTVVYTVPSDGATGVPINRKISVAFSEPMNAASVIDVADFTVTGPGAALVTAATISYDSGSHIALFTPSGNLSPDTTYTGMITVGAKNVAGNPLANNFIWTFTTGTTADTAAPLLVVTGPADLATNVPVNQVITATFNEPMDPLTITSTSYTVTGPSGPILGALTFAGTTATFTPVSLLATSTTYTAAIAASDLAGLAWVSGNVPNPWSFTTGTTSAVGHLGPAPVVLGTAGTFRVLAGSTITNTGVTTSIDGDAGVFPGSAVVGLTAANIVSPFGIHAGDVAAETAKVDLLAAYNDAQSRSTNAISLPGQLGGLTLAPGLYVNASTSGISGTGPNGILTLDAQGDPNAVWIFKMGSTLITDAGTSIVLAGNAQASNIFWQVGSSATLGVNSVFYGTILADASITMNTGAVLHGRALTRVGAVTLDTNQLVP